jgi:hypothetical protein
MEVPPHHFQMMIKALKETTSDTKGISLLIGCTEDAQKPSKKQ